MKKVFVFIMGGLILCSAFAAGENIPTSKSYVDAGVAEKQDKISANNGAARVLTNTGTAGEYETKGIYDSTGSYLAQTDALVDAVTMNTAVQNAIDSEFQCVEWADSNDHTSECLLMELVSQCPKNILNTINIHQGTIVGANGKVASAVNRCYFDYIQVKNGDVINITSKVDTPPVYHGLWIYSAPEETAWLGSLYGTRITIGDHVGYQFGIRTDGYIRGLWLQDARFTPDDLVEPMVEISTTPHEYVPYQIYLPSGN